MAEKSLDENVTISLSYGDIEKMLNIVLVSDRFEITGISPP